MIKRVTILPENDKRLKAPISVSLIFSHKQDFENEENSSIWIEVKGLMESRTYKGLNKNLEDCSEAEIENMQNNAVNQFLDNVHSKIIFLGNYFV